MKNELSSVGCRKAFHQGGDSRRRQHRSMRPLARTWRVATLVEDSLSLRRSEVFAFAWILISSWADKTEDAQPSIQDRTATWPSHEGSTSYETEFKGDAAIHPDETRWSKGHRLLAGVG